VILWATGDFHSDLVVTALAIRCPPKPPREWTNACHATFQELTGTENMRVHLSTLLVLTALMVGSLAEQIREGAKMEVKQDSIWFLEVGNLSTWQKLKKAGNSAEFESYQTQELGARDAWQFTKPLRVKIISFDPEKNQAKVELLTPGRYLGSTWWIDGNAFAK
jgi:hypothetical protein